MLPDYPEMVIVLLFIVRCKNRGVGYRLFSLFNAGIKFFAISLIILKVIGISFWQGMFASGLLILLFKSDLPPVCDRK
ncbi:hypothetical protein DIU36_03520 [Mucilaginibacter rubeus]|nr:hypothetical protein DIU36_03520 [Mucilaginibacter rubeus]